MSGPSVEEVVTCSVSATSAAGLAIAEAGCGTPSPTVVRDATPHERLAGLLRRYDVNDYAASMKVYAIKPR